LLRIGDNNSGDILLETSGNIGIGTNLPDKKLTVQAGGTQDGIRVKNDVGNEIAFIGNGSASNQGYMRLFNNSGSDNILLNTDGSSIAP